jgi:hypothetical protein
VAVSEQTFSSFVEKTAAAACLLSNSKAGTASKIRLIEKGNPNWPDLFWKITASPEGRVKHLPKLSSPASGA